MERSQHGRQVALQFQGKGLPLALCPQGSLSQGPAGRTETSGVSAEAAPSWAPPLQGSLSWPSSTGLTRVGLYFLALFFHF